MTVPTQASTNRWLGQSDAQLRDPKGERRCRDALRPATDGRGEDAESIGAPRSGLCTVAARGADSLCQYKKDFRHPRMCTDLTASVRWRVIARRLRRARRAIAEACSRKRVGPR